MSLMVSAVSSFPAASHPRSLLEWLTASFGTAYVFTVPWENVLIVPGIGTLNRIIGGMFIVGWTMFIVARGGIRLPHTFHTLIYANLAWISTTLLWTADAEASRVALLTITLLSITSMSLWDTFTSKEQILRLAQAYVLGCGIVFLLLLYNYLVGNTSAWEQRTSIANSNENEVGQTLAIGMPLAWFLATRAYSVISTSRVLQIYNFLFPGIAIIGILLTASRTGLVSTIPFFAFLIILGVRLSLQQRVLLFVSFVASVFAVIRFVPESSFDRALTIDEQIQGGDLGSRVDIWRRGWDLLASDPLRLVVGYGAATFESLIGQASHNIPLSVTVETGLVGVLIWVCMLFVVVSSIRKLHLEERLLWGSVLGVWGLGALVLNWHYDKVTWLVLALIIGYANPFSATSGTQRFGSEGFRT